MTQRNSKLLDSLNQTTTFAEQDVYRAGCLKERLLCMSKVNNFKNYKEIEYAIAKNLNKTDIHILKWEDIASNIYM